MSAAHSIWGTVVNTLTLDPVAGTQIQRTAAAPAAEWERPFSEPVHVVGWGRVDESSPLDFVLQKSSLDNAY